MTSSRIGIYTATLVCRNTLTKAYERIAMDAEIRFFMTDKDEAEFIAVAEANVDEIDTTNPFKHRFLVGDCELFFTPTLIEDNVMYTGVFEIRIKNNDDACKNQIRANASYKKLRNWIKKNYWSRLAFINENKKNKLTPSRIHWLAPDAKAWKESDEKNHLLKLSKTSWMTFDIGF